MFDGRGSERRLREDEACPQCKQKGVYYTGADVLHGNPFSPAADTEMRHYMECPHCSHQWSYLT